MTITGAIVLFSVIWFMVFFIVLPLRLVTQGDAGKVEPGTPAAAPAGFVVARKARITTLVTIVLWLIVAGIITSGWISVRDLDWFGRMSPPATAP
jgi:predicted secreted protein